MAELEGSANRLRGIRGGAWLYERRARVPGVEMLVVGATRQVNKTTVTTDQLVSTLEGGNVGTGVLIHGGRARHIAIISLGGS